MKIIIIKTCKDGLANEVKNVSDGYAKNFLIKKGLAIPFTESNEKMLHSTLKEIAIKRKEELVSLNELKNQIEKLNISFKLKETNMVIHGSITTKQVNHSLIENGIKLPKHSLNKVHIVSFGKTILKIKLDKEVIAKLNIEVLKDE